MGILTEIALPLILAFIMFTMGLHTSKSLADSTGTRGGDHDPGSLPWWGGLQFSHLLGERRYSTVDLAHSSDQCAFRVYHPSDHLFFNRTFYGSGRSSLFAHWKNSGWNLYHHHCTSCPWHASEPFSADLLKTF